MTTNTKVALVTGAGSGIGRATAVGLAAANYSVVLAGRRGAPLEELAAMARAAGGESRAVPTDVSEPSSVGALFEQVRREFGRLDVLFNNAGINVPAVPLEELTVEQWRSVVDINLTGAFLCTQAAIKLMK